MKASSIVLLSVIVVIIIVGAYFILNNSSQPVSNTVLQTSETPIGSIQQSPFITPQASVIGNNASVTIQNFAFSPATITISAGSAVTWVNQDSVSHNIVSDASSPLTFNSGVLAQGKGFSFTFMNPGTYNYHCSIHPSMLGKIIVQ